MNQGAYRVLSRTAAVWIGLLLLAAGALVVSLAIAWMNASTGDFARLLEQSPAQAAAAIGRRVRLYAWVYGGSLLAIAAWIAWMGSRIVRTACMPPPGAWIIAGQRTWSGDAAVRRGRILWWLAAALAFLSVGLFAALWIMAARVTTPAA